MKKWFGVFLAVFSLNISIARADAGKKTLLCDVRTEWDNGNRPIEEGSMVANMVLSRLNGTREKIELSEREGMATYDLSFKDLRGFAGPTRFVDDVFTSGSTLKFRGFLTQDIILAGRQLVFVKGYLLNCEEQ